MENNFEKLFEKYSGLDNYRKPKSDYISKLIAMNDEQILKECQDKIWFSAYAANNPRSDYHWQCDACYDFIVSKYGNDNIYVEAHKNVSRNI